MIIYVRKCKPMFYKFFSIVLRMCDWHKITFITLIFFTYLLICCWYGCGVVIYIVKLVFQINSWNSQISSFQELPIIWDTSKCMRSEFILILWWQTHFEIWHLFSSVVIFFLQTTDIYIYIYIRAGHNFLTSATSIDFGTGILSWEF